MYTISKEFAFSAAHQLYGLREGHPCGRLHGHNYVIRLGLQSEQLDAHSFVVDYGDLNSVKEWIDSELDHRNLNDVLPMQTSAENLARFTYERWCFAFPELAWVEVQETPKTIARYEPQRYGVNPL